MTSDAWFAVRTRSRHEKRVFQQLEQKSIEAFLPTITRWSRWRDRRKQVEWPLFPGYCFARVHPEGLLPVLKCAGVVGVVSFNAAPAPIPDYEIEGLRRLVESKLQFDPHPFIEKGDRVEVVHGPLRGVFGRLVKKGPNARLVLAVELLGRAVSVQVDSSDVVAS
jgi:transcription antitermination factor NusG